MNFVYKLLSRSVFIIAAINYVGVQATTILSPYTQQELITACSHLKDERNSCLESLVVDAALHTITVAAIAYDVSKPVKTTLDYCLIAGLSVLEAVGVLNTVRKLNALRKIQAALSEKKRLLQQVQ
jgi:hypothetical protein